MNLDRFLSEQDEIDRHYSRLYDAERASRDAQEPDEPPQVNYINEAEQAGF